MDLIDKKIKNIWLLFWLGTGVVYNGPKFFIAVIISFIPLFLLYRFRMVGAGDAKLIMLLCGFLGLFEGAGVVFVGMCFAAIYSFYLLYSKKILFLRLCYFFSFIKITIQTKKIGHYYEVGRDDPQLSIAMAPWFLCGFFVWRLIKIWMII